MSDAITAFTGSMVFVYIHLVIYGGWIAVNFGLISGAWTFGPSFVILAMEASVEAIFLSTFVPISQIAPHARPTSRQAWTCTSVLWRA